MRQEKGLYVVLFALLLFVLLGLVALALGLGMLGTSKTRLQNAVNLAALAAIEKFSSLPSTDTYVSRADAALQRASDILGANTMPGVSHSLGGLKHRGQPDSEGGILTLGNWYTKKPTGSNPCGAAINAYPCFVPNPNPSTGVPATTRVNAIRIDAHNQSGNPLIFRFAKFLGKDTFILWSHAIASIVPRCTAYLMDVGQSMTWETHPRYLSGPSNPIDNPCIVGNACSAGGPPNCPSGYASGCNPATDFNCFAGCNPAKYLDSATQPINVGLGAFRAQFTPTHLQCAFPAPASPEKEYYYWCNYPRLDDPRGGAFQSRSSEPTSPVFPHYQADYELENSVMAGVQGQAWIDKLYIPPSFFGDDPMYDGPQPYSRSFLAFNAGLRQVQSTTVGGDVSMVSVFTGIMRDRVPATGFTPDLGYLVQLTNLDNRGKRRWNGTSVSPEIHPNFVDRGWEPYPGNGADARSGLLPAIYQAAQDLYQDCPAGSKKSIILATDGILNCYFTAIPNSDCLNTFPYYQLARNQVLDTPIPLSGGGTKPPLLQMLKEYEVSLSVVLDGAHVNPNFMNIANPTCGAWQAGVGFGTDDPRCYYSMQEAFARGYSGYPDPGTGPIVDWNSYDNTGTPTSATTAFYKAGEPGWSFGEANGVWARVALETGGYFCPLLSVRRDPGTGAPLVSDYVDFANDRGGAACDQACPTGVPCSPCVLKSAYRNPTPGLNAQSAATEFMSKGEQAARCARNTVGLNPFTLVEKDNFLSSSASSVRTRGSGSVIPDP